MTPKQFRAALDKIGLSQLGAARFLNEKDRQIRRWIAGDAEIPESAAKLLRLMVRLGLKPEDVK